MPKFDRSSIQELKELLFNSCVHDAKVKNIGYNCGEHSMKIELFNPIFDVKTDFAFQNVAVALTVKGEELGSSETIVSITVEDDLSYLQTYMPKCDEYAEEAIYLLLQMFSGDELHILAKEVSVEIEKK